MAPPPDVSNVDTAMKHALQYIEISSMGGDKLSPSFEYGAKDQVPLAAIIPPAHAAECEHFRIYGVTYGERKPEPLHTARALRARCGSASGIRLCRAVS